MTLLSGDISLVPGPEKRVDREGAAAQHVLPSLTCAPFLCAQTIFQAAKKGTANTASGNGDGPENSARRAETAWRTARASTVGEPSAQQPRLPPPLGFVGNDGRKGLGRGVYSDPRTCRSFPPLRLTTLQSPLSAPRGTHLWEFIRDILIHPELNEGLMKWEDRREGVFKFLRSEAVAQLWGQKKKNSSMTYEKLSRAMR